MRLHAQLRHPSIVYISDCHYDLADLLIRLEIAMGFGQLLKWEGLRDDGFEMSAREALHNQLTVTREAFRTVPDLGRPPNLSGSNP
jgi:hypothetical protein